MDTRDQFLLFLFLIVPVVETAGSLQGSDDKGPLDTDENKTVVCIQGQYVDAEKGLCKGCPRDHYMDTPLHSYVRCYPCHHARQNSSEIDLVACTETHDTIIDCKDGWFPQTAPNDDLGLIRCLPCAQYLPQSRHTKSRCLPPKENEGFPHKHILLVLFALLILLMVLLTLLVYQCYFTLKIQVIMKLMKSSPHTENVFLSESLCELLRIYCVTRERRQDPPEETRLDPLMPV